MNATDTQQLDGEEPRGARTTIARLLAAGPWLLALLLLWPCLSSWSAERDVLERHGDLDGLLDEVPSGSLPAAFAIDDAYIYQVYARNLVAGHGYAFNAGKGDSAATSLLWAAVVSAVHRLPIDPLVGTKLLACLCAYFACVLAGLCVGRWTGSQVGACVASAALALTPRLAWAALTGMDPPLTLLLLGGGLYLCARARISIAGALLLALCGFTRPECLLVLPVLAAAIFLSRGEPRKAPVLFYLGAALLALGGYAAANLLLSGRPLPSTYYAKIGPSGLVDVLLSGGQGFGEMVDRLSRLPWLVYFFLFEDHRALGAFALLGCWFLRPSAEHPTRFFPALLLVLYPLCKELFAPSFNDILFQHGRQAAPLSLCYATLCGAAAAGILGQTRRWRWILLALVTPFATAIWLLFPQLPPGMPPAEAADLFHQAILAELQRLFEVQGVLALVALALVAILAALRHALLYPFAPFALLLFLLASLIRDATRIPEQSQAYENELALIVQMHVETGLWLRQNTRPEDVIGVNDIGAIGWYSQRRIVDLFGLVDQRILAYRLHPEAQQPQGQGGRADLDPRFLLDPAFRCDYLAVFPEWFPELMLALANAPPGAPALAEPLAKPLHAARVPPNTVTGALEKRVYGLLLPPTEIHSR